MLIVEPFGNQRYDLSVKFIAPATKSELRYSPDGSGDAVWEWRIEFPIDLPYGAEILYILEDYILYVFYPTRFFRRDSFYEKHDTHHLYVLRFRCWEEIIHDEISKTEIKLIEGEK
jgi:hypothetical protein